MHTTKLNFNNLFNKTNYIIIGGVFISLIFMIILCGAAPKKQSTAYYQYKSSYSSEEKAYTTITISSGDTLWSIADSYCNSDNNMINSFIQEIISINSLNTDIVTVGQKLLIPIY